MNGRIMPPPVEIVDNKTGKVVLTLWDQLDGTFTMIDEFGFETSISISSYTSTEQYRAAKQAY